MPEYGGGQETQIWFKVSMDHGVGHAVGPPVVCPGSLGDEGGRAKNTAGKNPHGAGFTIIWASSASLRVTSGE